jgi:hypothetical protein
VASVADASEMVLLDSQSGLWWGQLTLVSEDDSGEIPLYVLRLEPDKFEISLLSSEEFRTTPKTSQGWSKEFDYEIIFNAGMFRRDTYSPLGYCKNYEFVLNGNFNHHNSFLVINPTRKRLPSLRILDRQCDNIDSILKFYRTHLQSIRMLSCGEENCWKKTDKKHSILALASDSSDNLLLLFVQEPIRPHNFIAQISKMKLGIERMMYLEGGSHASLYAEIDNFTVDLHGYSDNPLPLKSLLEMPMPLPVVIALKRK